MFYFDVIFTSHFQVFCLNGRSFRFAQYLELLFLYEHPWCIVLDFADYTKLKSYATYSEFLNREAEPALFHLACVFSLSCGAIGALSGKRTRRHCTRV